MYRAAKAWLKKGAGVRQYLYNGKELNQDFGLDWYDYGARWYDASIGRWNAVDALADEPEQIDKSVYAYAWNNPVNLTDPDGNCPSCIVGALVGGGLDLAFQTVVEGKSLSEVNWGSVAVSAGSGAVGGGLLSGASKLIKGAKAVKKTSQLAKNVKQSKKFEKKVLKNLSKTQEDVVEQITVKTKSGTRTRLDMVGKDKATGKIKLTEAKSSQKAPLTKNQKKAFPEIKKDGATVVGKGKGAFTGGTKIPPTKVTIKRPKRPWWKIF